MSHDVLHLPHCLGADEDCTEILTCTVCNLDAGNCMFVDDDEPDMCDNCWYKSDIKYKLVTPPLR